MRMLWGTRQGAAVEDVVGDAAVEDVVGDAAVEDVVGDAAGRGR